MATKIELYQDLDKMVSLYGRGGDVASLAKNMTAAPNKFDLTDTLTDVTKVALSFANQLGFDGKVTGMVNNLVVIGNTVVKMRENLDKGDPITADQALKLGAAVAELAVDVASFTPAGRVALLAKEGLGTTVKALAAGSGYVGLIVDGVPLTQRIAMTTTLGASYRTLDQSLSGTNNTTLSFSDVAGGGFEVFDGAYASGGVSSGTGIRILPGTLDTDTVVATRLNNRFEATDTFEVYTVKSGDVASKIAQRAGISESLLLKSNPQITNPNLILAGEQIKIPKAISDGNASKTPTGTIPPNSFYIDDLMSYSADDITYFTGVPLSTLQQLNSSIDFTKPLPAGQTLKLPSPDNSLLTVGTATSTTQWLGATNIDALGAGVAQGLVYAHDQQWRLPEHRTGGHRLRRLPARRLEPQPLPCGQRPPQSVV